MTRKKKTNTEGIELALEVMPELFNEEEVAAEDAVEAAVEPLEELPVPEVAIEEEVAVEPAVEAIEVRPVALGHGAWDEKYNAARQRKSPAARKYLPVNRQR